MTAKEMELHPDSDGAKDQCASYHTFFGKNGPGSGSSLINEELGIKKQIN